MNPTFRWSYRSILYASQPGINPSTLARIGSTVYLSANQTKIVIHAYATFKLGQNNSLLYDISGTKVSTIQLVQNAAATLRVGDKKRDHVAAILKELHWLPAEDRITFKVLLVTAKVLNYDVTSY